MVYVGIASIFVRYLLGMVIYCKNTKSHDVSTYFDSVNGLRGLPF